MASLFVQTDLHCFIKSKSLECDRNNKSHETRGPSPQQRAQFSPPIAICATTVIKSVPEIALSIELSLVRRCFRAVFPNYVIIILHHTNPILLPWLWAAKCDGQQLTKRALLLSQSKRQTTSRKNYVLRGSPPR